ncbi:MAG: hypothetical protein P8K27_08380, partial [Gammaproteobacteria bacterium]|nr:hypothetical protein [Gammaproteobacteria bacterium]
DCYFIYRVLLVIRFVVTPWRVLLSSIQKGKVLSYGPDQLKTPYFRQDLSLALNLSYIPSTLYIFIDIDKGQRTLSETYRW